MITKRIAHDFYERAGSPALTLSPDEVREDNDRKVGTPSRTHSDGWTISGEIHEDYYEWVNEFEASHPVFGRVWGDFEGEVFADSEEGFQDFYARHTPEAWDYWDI